MTASRNSLRELFRVALILLGFTYLLRFVSDEELDSPADPKDSQEVYVKEEPFEYDATSGDHSNGDAVSDAHNFDVYLHIFIIFFNF